MTHHLPPKLQDPLTRHYFELVVMIEQLVLARVPRLPLMPAPKPLDTHDVLAVAERFAAAHDLGHLDEPQVGICGDVHPWAGYTNICDLPAGHDGWHATGAHTSWGHKEDTCRP